METTPKRTSKDDGCAITTMESLKKSNGQPSADQNTLSMPIFFSRMKKKKLAKRGKKEIPKWQKTKAKKMKNEKIKISPSPKTEKNEIKIHSFSTT
jgi:hypothetical protein